MIRPLVQTILLLAMAFFLRTSQAQLQWNAYNNTNGLVTANVASGGDAGYGGSVNFTIPASTELIFTTETFVPTNIAAASAFAKINFTMSANGGMYPGSTGRILGMGLLNDPGTPNSASDDSGYWVDFNTGNPSFELFYRPGSALNTFFQYDSGHKLSTGKTATGYPSNNVPYGMQFQLNENSGANGISIGTSSSWPNCGAGMTNGNGSVNELAYSSANSLSTLSTTTFNEFAFMFNNTSVGAVTVTLNNLNLVPANGEIISQPANTSVASGTTATFTVVVNTNAAGTLGYQWYETNATGVVALPNGPTGTGSTVSGASTVGAGIFTNTLTFSNAQLADANNNIFVVITNAYGAVTSSPVLFGVTPGDTAPIITSISLTNAVIVSGQGTNVTVLAIASPAPTYYWLDNNNNLLQSGSAFTLALNNLSPANAGTYTVIASNYLGTATTNFTIGIIVPPCISQQPTNVLVNVGDPVTFSAAEGGCASPAPNYQWYKNGTPISGATSTSYSIASVALSDIAYYTVGISNSAGVVISSAAKLAIYSTAMTGSPVLPASTSTGVCVDTYLQISFNEPPTIGNVGKVNIYDTANPATPVDTLDLSQNNSQGVQPHSPFPGDSQAFNYYPVVVSGNTASIYPHLGILNPNQTYFVTIDPGVIVDTNGAYFSGISNPTTWQFTTKATGPANPTNLVVDASGNGDFLTVQGAVDAIPLQNTNYTLINIRNGTYFEIVDIASKNNVTFRGQSRSGTVVGYLNNAIIAPGGSTHARMAFKVDADNIAIENLTVTNMTPQGGQQAEALMIESGAARFILNNANVASRQDTILANVNSSQGYFYNSLVQGNYDYVWGGGNLYFDTCTLETIAGASTANLTAARTDTSAGTSSNFPWLNPGGTYTANGMSFVNCSITADAGVGAVTLADGNGSAGNNVSWYDCAFATNYVAPSAALFGGNFVFWQDLNTTNGSPVTYANVVSIGGSDPRLLAATNIPTWFYGWNPQLAPNILTNPAAQSVSGGGTATFTVAATGIPAPAYQWLSNSVPIAGQTAATLTIGSANANDAAAYSVIVSNVAGTVTSTAASLSVGSTAPTLTPASDVTVNVGVDVSVANVASDPDVPANSLTFSLPQAPVGAAVDGNGNFTWRPTVSFAGTVNPVQVVVTDNGAPPLSATNNFNVTVNPLTSPVTSAPTFNAGVFSITVTGQAGPDYELQVTTNLLSGIWTDVVSTNSPSSPFTLSDPNATGSMQFYRIVTGPPLP